MYLENLTIQFSTYNTRIMTKIFFILLISFSINLQAQTVQDTITKAHSVDSIYTKPVENIQLDEGSMVKLELLNEISSDASIEGDIVDFAVSEDVVVNNRIVIKAGTKLTGTIEKAIKAKSVGKPGELKYTLNSVKSVDGTKINLKTSRANLEGQDKVDEAVVLAVVISPIFLLKKGKNIKMEAGKIIQAYTDKDYVIQITN